VIESLWIESFVYRRNQMKIGIIGAGRIGGGLARQLGGAGHQLS
jgi:phosphoglycerate dehydrogenase-like enzyme